MLFFPDEQKWVRVDNVGYRPHGRRSLCAVHFSEDKVLYFGGYNARLKRHFSDVFIYNASKCNLYLRVDVPIILLDYYATLYSILLL